MIKGDSRLDMVNKEDKRESILRHAFEVFIEKGYDKVSITTLQEHMKISRGVLYSYFESKDGLFEAVVNKYMFPVLDSFFPEFEKEEVTVSERIVLLKEHLLSVTRYFLEKDKEDIRLLNFFILFIQASRQYPALLNRIADHKKKNLNAWKKAVVRSIEKGEIRKDVDVNLVALHFSKISGAYDGIDGLDRNFGQRAESDVQLMEHVLDLYR